jgi:aryl-alcohol dehydrogenase-like predicted oxidoreductase
LVRALELIAKEKGVTTAQLEIAWVLYRGDDVIPLIGARNRQRLQESVSALDLTLTEEELARIERAVPAEQVAGTRYAEAQMYVLDSERSSGR